MRVIPIIKERDDGVLDQGVVEVESGWMYSEGKATFINALIERDRRACAHTHTHGRAHTHAQNQKMISIYGFGFFGLFSFVFCPFF